MRDAIADLALQIPAVTDEHQAAQLYWDAYRNLVPIANPSERQKIMQFMACGAWLECASLIGARAYPELIWTARSQRKAVPPTHTGTLYEGTAWLADGMSRRHEGDALLLALVRHAFNVRAHGAQKASA